MSLLLWKWLSPSYVKFVTRKASKASFFFYKMPQRKNLELELLYSEQDLLFPAVLIIPGE